MASSDRQKRFRTPVSGTEGHSRISGAGSPDQPIRAVLDGLGRSTAKRDLVWLGGYLGRLVGRRPFTYRHLYSVLRGSYAASRILDRALAAALAALDGAHPLAGHRPTMVLAPPGCPALGAGAQILGDVEPCRTPGCPVVFVPNHPRRRHCYLCSPPSTRRP